MEKKIEISVGDVIVVNHVEIRAEKRTGWQGCECCFSTNPTVHVCVSPVMQGKGKTV